MLNQAPTSCCPSLMLASLMLPSLTALMAPRKAPHSPHAGAECGQGREVRWAQPGVPYPHAPEQRQVMLPTHLAFPSSRRLLVPVINYRHGLTFLSPQPQIEMGLLLRAILHSLLLRLPSPREGVQSQAQKPRLEVPAPRLQGASRRRGEGGAHTEEAEEAAPGARPDTNVSAVTNAWH